MVIVIARRGISFWWKCEIAKWKLLSWIIFRRSSVIGCLVILNEKLWLVITYESCDKPGKQDHVIVPWFGNNDSEHVLHWMMFDHLDSSIDHVDTHKEMIVDRPEFKSVYFLALVLRNWNYIMYPIIFDMYLTTNSIGITLTSFRIANSLTITATQLTIASDIIISWYRIIFNYVTTSLENSSTALWWDGIKGQVILSLVIIGITFRFGTWVGDNIDLNVNIGKMETIGDDLMGTPYLNKHQSRNIIWYLLGI